jgi:hypothetical protein
MNRKLIFFAAVFILLRILLFRVNISEWGDSYSIVSAAESLRSSFSYPVDEKRLPLFSLLIALNPLPVEMMIWAKILQVIFTAGILLLTCKLAQRLFPDLSDFGIWVLGFGLLLNPVFLYWSIRVVAGVLLAFLVLLAFNIYHSESSQTQKLSLLGIVVGLAALTRYEGFLLAVSFGLIYLLLKKVRSLALYSSLFILVVAPWFVRNLFVFGNPFFSTYFSEPTTYTYDLKTLLVFLASWVFLFGFPPAFYFFARGGLHFFRKLKGESRRSPLLAFIFLELLLILFWPAAVPRLFLPLIPIFLLFLVKGLDEVRSEQRGRLFVASLLLTFLYVVSQYTLRLHFLVLSKSILALVVALGLLSAFSWLVFDFGKAKKVFLGLFLVSQIVSSFVIINNHRRIYSDALYAAQFASSLGGLVGYSDETGVVEYYLGGRGRRLPDKLFESRQQWQWLEENNIRYLLATDEYEQRSRFKVFADPLFEEKFRLLGSWEVDSAELFDFWLMSRGILPYHEYPVKHSFVYEIL